MLHQNQRIGTGGAHGFNRLDAEIDVLVGDAFGLVAVEVAVAVRRILRFQHFRGHVPQIAVQLQLAQFMEKGAFLCIGGRLVRKLLGQLHRRWAHHPAMRTGGVEPSVGTGAVLDLAHSAATSSMTAAYWLS